MNREFASEIKSYFWHVGMFLLGSSLYRVATGKDQNIHLPTLFISVLFVALLFRIFQWLCDHFTIRFKSTSKTRLR